MNRASAIFRWLHVAKRLARGRAVTVAIQLSDNTSARVFANSGELVTWQSIPRMSGVTGLCPRSVRYGVRELQAVGLVAAEISRGGRGRSNCYTLTLPPAANDDRISISSDRISRTNSATETLQADAGFNEAKPCKPVQVENLQTLQADDRNPAKYGPKPCKGVQPNYERNISRTVATTTETDDRGPRRALEALGPPQTTGKGLGNGAAEPAPPKSPRPHADVEATIRTVLADRARLFAGARVTEADARSILIDCATDYLAGELRRFESDIKAATGAEQVRFTVALGPGLTKRGPS